MNTNQKNIIIVGATGLIGRQLVGVLIDGGYNPIVLSRNPPKARELFPLRVNIVFWDGKDDNVLMQLIDGAKAIVNLAGESIASRWTQKKKELILTSRINSTNAVVRAIKKCNTPPEVFIQASAIGYYPHNMNAVFDEGGVIGSGFLSQVVMRWEQAATKVEGKCRLVIIRTGVVLSNQGGFLDKIITSIKLFAGGWFGNGRQMLSWIHINDHVKAILFLIQIEENRGIFNLVSPNPISYKQFVKCIGKFVNRPAIFRIPEFFLKIIFGKMAEEVILSDQNVIPKRLILNGFEFDFKSVDNALRNLLLSKKL